MRLRDWSYVVVALAGCGRLSFDHARATDDIADGRPDTSGATIDAFVDTSCAYQCAIDVLANSNTCSGPITASLMGSRGVASVDMSGRTTLELRATICNPLGWVFHVGDSPTNDGSGGDVGSTSNDAEAYFFMDTSYQVYGNDYAPTTGKLLADQPGVLAGAGCNDVHLIARDQYVELVTPAPLVTSSPYALRIDPPTDTEGTPDAIWYVGLNRTVGNMLRNGSGVETVALCQK